MRLRCDKGSIHQLWGARCHDERGSWVRMTDRIGILAGSRPPQGSPAQACAVLGVGRRNNFPIAAKPSGNNHPLASAAIKHVFSVKSCSECLCRVRFTAQTDPPIGRLCW